MGNRFNRLGHIGLGIAGALLNLHLVWTKREIDQLPPENDDNPVMYLSFAWEYDWADGQSIANRDPKEGGDHEYWSKARVMDTLDDSWDYAVGETIGWVMLVAGLLAIGKWVM